MAPIQQALAQLSSVCPRLAPQIDPIAQSRLQAFYQQQGDLPLWSANERRQALHTQLLMLADDGLDPGHYSLPTADTSANVLCSDIDTSRQYLQALQDLHYGRLQQSRFEPLWHAQPPAQDPNSEVLALAAAGLQDMASAFDQARPSADLYRSLRNAYSAVRQQPLPLGSLAARCCAPAWTTRAYRNWRGASTSVATWPANPRAAARNTVRNW